MGLTFTVHHACTHASFILFRRYRRGRTRGRWYSFYFIFDEQLRLDGNDLISASLELLPHPDEEKVMHLSCGRVCVPKLVDTHEKGIQWIGFEEPSRSLIMVPSYHRSSGSDLSWMTHSALNQEF